ncbi:MAG: alcohol dehydrogenase catalytic domain-containing protein [Syntrophales bacterium]|nr:alcohol dehydrogenase catalytic domain-containing protein [Syntrophales bacterium]
MKALVYLGPRDIRYKDYPDAILGGPDEALVKVAKTAICGSDLHIYHGEYPTPDTGFIVGHEFIGEVLEVGSNVRGFKPGDRVLSSASIGCPDCPECLKGRVGRCHKGPFSCYGQGSMMGALQGVQTELVSVPAANTTLRHIPPDISDDQAILLVDNLPTAYLGAKNADIRPGFSVVVIGLGPVGLLCAECAFILGAARVFAIDLVQERLAYAASLGAIPIKGDNIQEQILSANYGVPVDSVIDTVCNEFSLKLSFRLARKEGTVSEIGVSFTNSFNFPLAHVQSKSLAFRIALTSVQEEWPELIPLVQGGRIKSENVITHHMGLSEGAEAYRMTVAREAGVMKIVMDPSK